MSIELKLEKLTQDSGEESFSGPLGLLLSLLGEKKLDVTEIALSQITEQYLAYLDTLEKNREEELADFLVIAAKLLLLKSRTLLSQFFPEEEDIGTDLEDQLRLYKRFVDVSKKINAMWLEKRQSSFRIEPTQRPVGFEAPGNLDTNRLQNSFAELLKRLKPPKPLPKTHIDKTVSVREKIDQIRSFLKKKSKLNFFQTFADSGNKTEIIVGFLALLELVKQQHVGLTQSGAFADIVIERI